MYHTLYRGLETKRRLREPCHETETRLALGCRGGKEPPPVPNGIRSSERISGHGPGLRSCNVPRTFTSNLELQTDRETTDDTVQTLDRPDDHSSNARCSTDVCQGQTIYQGIDPRHRKSSPTVFTMYLQTCAALSIAELSLLMFMHGVPPIYNIGCAYLVLFSLQYASINLYYTLIFPFYVSSLRYMPGPKDHHFLIGHALNQFRANGPYELYLSWSRRWPTAPFIRYISFANTETLLVNSLRAHQEVLSTKCYSFVKPPFFARIVGEVTGMGLVFAEGEEHRKQRKMLNGTFSGSF
jgi:hypothetical protein